jgi:hypothetical protein
MKFFQTTAYTSTVWFLAALIHAFLLAVIFAIAVTDAKAAISFAPAILCSLVFSVPGVFCFWIVFLIAAYNNYSGQSLFRLLLGAALVFACLNGLAIGYLFRSFLQLPAILTAFTATIASMLSLFAHRSSFIVINKSSKPLQYV